MSGSYLVSPGSGFAGLAWPGVAGLAVIVAAGLIGLRLVRPDWFTRFIACPARDRWRGWFYQRHWHAAMTLAGLAPVYRGRVMLPVLGKVRVTGAVDLATVGLVIGQAPGDFAERSENLAHAFGARLWRAGLLRQGVSVSVTAKAYRLLRAQAQRTHRSGRS